MRTISTKLSFTFLLLFSIILFSCGNKKASSQAQEETIEQTSNLDVDQLLAEADNLIDQSITVEGVCTHICKHGGRKIFLMGSDDTKTIRVECGEVGKFDAKCVNNIVTVTGKVREQRIDEAYLQQWETQLAEQTAEQHGDGEAGCSSEQKARNEIGNTQQERIDNFRHRIAEREEKDGKVYLSFYYMDAENYTILD